ncbi:30S ribosomal protein S10 [Candidatus Cytomitobacter primus]|nr:30S ribosomal protein S10 [Candidatus Cytomitobacter primus]
MNTEQKKKTDSVSGILKKKFKKKGFVRVILRSSDVFSLDKAALLLVENVKKVIGSGNVIGPVPLPKKRKVWTILSSPHIDKKARHQLERFVRTRIIELPSSKEVMDILDGSCSIPASVEIEIKA